MELNSRKDGGESGKSLLWELQPMGDGKMEDLANAVSFLILFFLLFRLKPRWNFDQNPEISIEITRPRNLGTVKFRFFLRKIFILFFSAFDFMPLYNFSRDETFSTFSSNFLCYFFGSNCSSIFSIVLKPKLSFLNKLYLRKNYKTLYLILTLSNLFF